jgi:S-DNA-T family DNA segregation ATPase FtsK/SpoIIIE
MALPAPEVRENPLGEARIKGIEIPQKLKDEIAGITMLSCSVLLLTGFFIDSSSILCRISSMVIGILGCGAYLFSLVLWLWGIERFRSRTFLRGAVDYAGWTLSFFTVVVSGQAINATGGTLGATLWPILIGAFGKVGSVIVLITCAAISTVLVLEILFSDFIARARRLSIVMGRHAIRVGALFLASLIRGSRTLLIALWAGLRGAMTGAVESLGRVFGEGEDPEDSEEGSVEIRECGEADSTGNEQRDCAGSEDIPRSSSGSTASAGRKVRAGSKGSEFAGREILVEAIGRDGEPATLQSVNSDEVDADRSGEYISRLDTLLTSRDETEGFAAENVPEKFNEKAHGNLPEKGSGKTEETRHSAEDILAGVQVINTSSAHAASRENGLNSERTLSGSRLPSDLKALLENAFDDSEENQSLEDDSKWEEFSSPNENNVSSQESGETGNSRESAETRMFMESEGFNENGDLSDDEFNDEEETFIDSSMESDQSDGGENSGEFWDDPEIVDPEETVSYVLPPVTLLDIVPEEDVTVLREELREKGERIITTLANFSIEARIVQIVCGPSVTQFEIKIAKGVKVSKIYNLQDDIGLALATSAIRIEAPIPGKSAIGIEIPNSIRTPVVFREIMENLLSSEGNSALSIGFGKDIAGRYINADLAKMPHLLVAGATGSGKSVCMNTIICSMLFLASPNDVKFIMVDPKMVEMAVYKDIPHLMVPPVVDAKEAAAALNWCVGEMEKRYELLSAFGIRHISSYNKMIDNGEIRRKVDKLTDEQVSNFAPFVRLPFIVVIIDELADLMMVASKDVETAISRLAAKARAIGIHLVIATQRPSVNVITGVIKANLPSRIAFAVSSVVDSKTILDSKGAERLLGQGDMLFSPVGQNKPTRLQGAFISDDEVERLCDFLREQGEPSYDMDILKVEGEGEDDDIDLSDLDSFLGRDKEIVKRAACHVIETGHASASGLQRSLRLGYARAGRIIDTLEKLGIIGPKDSRNNREILMPMAEAQDLFL